MKKLTERQAEIDALVGRGFSDKAIAERTGLSISTVRVHIQGAASRLDGDTYPRHKLTLWFFNLAEGERSSK